METIENNVVVQNSFENSLWSEETAIRKVMPIGTSKLKFEAELPATGSNRGYFVRMIDLATNKEVAGTYKEFTTTKSHIEDFISSNHLNFESNDYRLEFGPHYQATNVNAVGATVDIVQGQPSNFQSSSITGLADTREYVSYRYRLCKEIFDTNTTVEIYLVKGQGLKGRSSAIGNKINTLKKGDPYRGTGTLEYSLGVLEEGVTYTVCVGIFSSVRQIAGYSFIAQ